jgi:hypothetical protein
VIGVETIKDGEYDDTDAPKAYVPSTKNARVSLEVEHDHVRDCCGVVMKSMVGCELGDHSS